MSRDRARLCLLRHGQGRLGTADYDRLSPVGQTQSERLSRRLSDDYGRAWQAWSGTLTRHRQTLARLDAEGAPVEDDRLNEYTVDALIRSAVDQAEQLGIEPPAANAFDDPAAYLETFLRWFPEVLAAWQAEMLRCHKNGLWSAFHARVLAPVEHWQGDLRAGKSLVVVTSAGVISTITAELLGRDLAWQRELNVSLYNASVTELVLDPDGRWQVDRVNCIDHLDEPGLRTLA